MIINIRKIAFSIMLLVSSPAIAGNLTASQNFFDQSKGINRDDYHRLHTSKVSFATSSSKYELRVGLDIDYNTIKQYFKDRDDEDLGQSPIVGQCFLDSFYKRTKKPFAPIKLFLASNSISGGSGRTKDYFKNQEINRYRLYYILEKKGSMIAVPKDVYVLDCEIYIKKDIPNDINHMITVVELNMIK